MTEWHHTEGRKSWSEQCDGGTAGSYELSVFEILAPSNINIHHCIIKPFKFIDYAMPSSLMPITFNKSQPFISTTAYIFTWKH